MLAEFAKGKELEPILIQLTPEQAHKAKILAAIRGISRNALFRQILEKELSELNKEVDKVMA